MRPVRQGTDDVEIRGKRIPGAGNSKRKGPSVRQGCAGPVEAEPEGQRALLTFQLRGERVRGEGLSPGVSTASALLSLSRSSPSWAALLWGHRWVLVFRAPCPPPASPNTRSGDRKCRPSLPSCLGGTPPSWAGLPEEGQRPH